MKSITVLGVGNILWKDEGFGVRVIEKLQADFLFPQHVQVLDGGTLGMELLQFLKGTKRMLIVDAIDGGGEAGAFYRLTGEEVDAYFQEKLSVHELGVKDVLGTLAVIGEPIEEVVVLGVQPGSLDMGLDLSAEAAAKLEESVTAVLSQLSRWQSEAWPNMK